MNKDILDLDIDSLYFDAPLAPEIEKMIKLAGSSYGSDQAELLLLQAYLRAPENLTVIVALYRYYYYQHRLQDALLIAERSLEVTAKLINLHHHWKDITSEDLAGGVFKSVGLVRFYLLSLKALGVVKIRLGDTEPGIEAVRKVCSLDPKDHLKTLDFLKMIEKVTHPRYQEWDGELKAVVG
jgi:tetratricopeptide (TPR) repeat protein